MRTTLSKEQVAESSFLLTLLVLLGQCLFSLTVAWLASCVTSDCDNPTQEALPEEAAANDDALKASAEPEPASPKTCAARASRDEGNAVALSIASSSGATRAHLCSLSSSSSSDAESNSSGSEAVTTQAARAERVVLGEGTFGRVYVEGGYAFKEMECRS